MFQSTRPRRARPTGKLKQSRLSRFQSTRPRRARRYIVDVRKVDTRFNPRAREGRDGTMQKLLDMSTVSIHAPAKGATYAIFFDDANIFVSIHAPAKGATAKGT